MTAPIPTLTPQTVRRLSVVKQRLAELPAAVDRSAMLDVARAIRALQLDPISVVARSHTIVMWSRVGNYDTADLDALIYRDKQLFEFWAHCASLVLTEDLPIFAGWMRRYPNRESVWAERTRQWMSDNDKLRRYILRRIKAEGPLLSRQLEHDGLDPKAWVSTGWTSGRNVSRMLDFLWMQGKIMVARRDGLQKAWDLAERVLPDWAPKERLSPREASRRAAEHALRALGAATPQHINYHFTRGRYHDLARALDDLERGGRIKRVNVAGLKGTWYLHADDLTLAERVARDDWHGRTVVLSPFDNLIADRKRTELLFDFRFRIEIYTPQDKRTHGYYVLPVLQDDRLVARADMAMDRAKGVLRVPAVHYEPTAPRGRDLGLAVRDAIQSFAGWLGARDVAHA